jgi:hypothetical protein
MTLSASVGDMLAFSIAIDRKADACLEAWGDRWKLVGKGEAELQRNARKRIEQLVLGHFKVVKFCEQPQTIFGKDGSGYRALERIRLGSDGIPYISETKRGADE